MPPLLSSSIYTIIGFAWPVFGFIFICLLCTPEWFGLKLIWFFPLAVLLCLALGHCLATLFESDAVTSLCYFFKRGMPLIFYRRFAFVEEAEKETAVDPAAAQFKGQPAITFGQRRVLLSAIDELFLTFLGTLEIRSYAASGRLSRKDGAGAVNKPDVLVKVPLSTIGIEREKELIALFRTYRPDLLVNKRLTTRLSSPVVKGQALIQSFGAVIIVLALIDVSYATFTWLEIVKNYYCAQVAVRHPDDAREHKFLTASEEPKAAAERYFAAAEELRTHPSAISWAYRALFANANSQAQLLSIKAETLYRLGHNEEAIDTLQKALELSTTGYKTQLQLARYLADSGRAAEAMEALEKVVKRHKEALLPRVYGEAIEMEKSDAAAGARYNEDLSALDEEVFDSEPAWPPGGEKPLMEVWRRDDLTFLAQRFVLRQSHNQTQTQSQNQTQNHK